MSLLPLLPFALFFLNDLNDYKLKKKYLIYCFPLGVVLLTVFVVMKADSRYALTGIYLRACIGIVALVFLILTLVSLFFALPIGLSYTAPGGKRPTQTEGVYALCRHPGVLWFSFLFLSMWPSIGLPPLFVCECIALNILLALFEDLYVFPAILTGYDAYKSSTPFLIPSKQSISLCISYYLRKRKDEGK